MNELGYFGDILISGGVFVGTCTLTYLAFLGVKNLLKYCSEQRDIRNMEKEMGINYRDYLDVGRDEKAFIKKYK